ncbi:unnamed protein product [Urochloa decumbens]|uniref:Ubiquitin-like protease family profile domain-containing protein n=1 Tax=Urochloa decumbens TaxID=240449 RepID=A0ABC9BFP6_9POAL
MDCNSCGAYILKYMLEWNGVQMRHNFTQDQMKIFKRKICCRMLRSECNKSRRASYKDPLTMQEYKSTANNQKASGSDDKVEITGTKNGTKNHKTNNMSKNAKASIYDSKKDQENSSQVQKKRGRPRKDGLNSNASTKPASQESEKTPVENVRGENQRVSNPSQYKLNPYKQP